ATDLVISRSMLSETVLHPTRAFLGGLNPTRKTVVATAWLASATMAVVAGGGMMSSRAELTLEVDGVSQPITTWGGSV
ncbi:lytic transglycosylase, partial [Actinomyces urogenitalis]|nr:lytic transglycosylase [Actinomyces urogenitalis]